MSYLNNRITASIFFNPVVENEVLRIINDLKNSSPGWDGFQAKLVKHVKDVIAPVLVHVCNLSLESGVFPYELKIANVVPIFKAGEDDIFSNYRPVSVLTVFSKLYERIVYSRLLMFLDKHFSNTNLDFENTFQRTWHC